MKYNIFILEDSKLFGNAYKDYLSEHNVFLFGNFSEAVNFVNSPDFSKIDLAILDVNIGKGLKIGGFNIAFQILKINPSLPIVICTGFKDDEDVKKYTKLLKTELIEKPFTREISATIERIMNNRQNEEIHSLEALIRSFITSGIYLRQLITFNYKLQGEHLSLLDKLTTVEQNTISDIEKIDRKIDNNNIVFDINLLNKNDIIFYIDTILSLSKSFLLNRPEIDEEERKMADEIYTSGEFLKEKLLNG